MAKKSVIYVLVVFFIGLTWSKIYAQKKYKKHYSFGIFYEQNTSFRILNFGKGVEVQRDWYERRKSTEKPIATNKFGGYLLYHLNKKWAIKSGFQVARYGNITQPADLIIGYTLDTLEQDFYTIQLGLGTPILTPNVDGNKYKSEFFYYEIPISAYHKVQKSGFLSFLEFGFLLGVEGKKRFQSITINENSVRKYKSVKPNFNIGIEWLLGFNLLAKDRLNIQLSPSFAMYLFNHQKQPFKEKLYAFGLRLQTSFSTN